ncbi:helix-turn-helix domain-containing protein [Bacillus sp. HSf4]|uniref:helix-turn-helix domain-containing protein n=1 Tax=Bacillus sp. HSf4 TaxID=3035514 RepID=UPI0024097CD6|nr:helix-turn-helix domain-containing protein [Bacillus sp. HSf4]WFA03824.1 helix-turn-helix domain-containing protein [Bacillus sp. HSf4]
MKIIDNQSKRIIRILKLLTSENKWWSLQEIADENIGSVRTIQNDLELMKEYKTVEGEPLIRIERRKGISICFTQFYRVDYYIKEILKKNFAVQLIQGIFFEQKKFFQRWMDTLNVSRSTMYATVKKINDKLKDYGIKLRSDTMEFYGDEKEIRHFFAEFFFEVYGNKHWPFPTIEKKVVSRLLLDIFNTLQVNVPDIALDKYCVSLAVTIHRVRHNHKIKRRVRYPLPTDRQTSEAKKILDQLKQSIEHFNLQTSKLFNITIDHDELVFLLFIEFSAGNHKSLESVKQKLSFFRVHTPKLYDAVYSFIDQLELIYNKEISNSVEIAALLLYFHIYINEIKVRDGFIFKKKDKFLAQVKKQLPYFYSNIMNIISQFKTDDLLSSFVKNKKDLICIITSNWRGLVHLEMQRKSCINILVTSILGYNHCLFVADLIKRRTNNYVQIFASRENALNANYLNEFQINLIVTDTDTALPDHMQLPILMVSSFPTRKELDKIHDIVAQMSEKYLANNYAE